MSPREICDYVTTSRSVKEFSGINNNGFDLFIEKDSENIRLVATDLFELK